ncbi:MULTISPECIES: adenylate/guanylate cyclase domain-containing protein [unclassified Rhizobium]|uniref:adenylate/guanylate cyclase domain-containing protein n=1 Tax=unclassified Rhizobium TaxID=2613769 RepID=UPI00216880C9|nr:MULTISPECIES: adenylate/guanylate cyclase domain-containing protein [unclassified Rhizobium]MCS3740709.1 class 3 adenylate cyclase [Rhizobium sp. BK661]MCS4092456.1 class 3 adenylate cyclase [Rhizobium sp. BK176]
MNEMRRKLTTIFSADVQDYTRLMGADEEGTLAMLKWSRDAMSRLIGAHGGRVINTWGDGLIAEFPSVVEAVRAAIDVQNELVGMNAARPADGRMLYRIGINLGDVLAEGDDIYGDGVNIAARLQASAPAGGIVISNTVYDQVRNKVAVGFDFLGALTVKNVSEAVPSYSVRIGVEPSAGPAPAAGPSPAVASEPIRLSDPRVRKMGGVFAVVAIALLVINLLSWQGVFWAAWPLLALAFVVAMGWVRSQNRFDRRIAGFAIVGIGIVMINLLSWHGVFWAIWPLLGLAVTVGLRWAMRR